MKAGPTPLASPHGGEATIGRPAICTDNRGSLCAGDHEPLTVSLTPYEMEVTEVSRLQYYQCIVAGLCAELPDLDKSHRVSRPNNPVLVDDPAKASAYCQFRGLRLPTEAEFEFAMDGLELGSHAETEQGVRDLAGGVPEWVLDRYDPRARCVDRLSLQDLCQGVIGCECATSTCGQCLPAAETGFGQGGSGSTAQPDAGAPEEDPLGTMGADSGDTGQFQECPSGSGGAPLLDPVFTGGSHGVIRGGFEEERSCFALHYTRRHAAPGTSFFAGFRCVRSEAMLTTPIAFRFRLQDCPSPNTIVRLELTGQEGEYTVDFFQSDGSYTSSRTSGGVLDSVSCGTAIAVRATRAHTLTIRATAGGDSTTEPDPSKCGGMMVWNAQLTSAGGDVPAVGLMALPGTGEVIDLQNDPNNCGACGRQCLGGACDNGQCDAVLVADFQSTPFAVVADAQNVYWGNQGDSRIMKCNLTMSTMGCNGAPTHLASISNPRGLALDATNLYMAGTEGVRSCAITGCARFATDLDNTIAGNAVALDGLGRIVYSTTTYEVRDCTLPTCASASRRVLGRIITQSDGSPIGVAVDSSAVYFLVGAPPPNFGIGSLRRCPRAGCPLLADPPTLVPGLQTPLQLLLDGGQLYWTQIMGGVVERCTAGTSCVPENLASGQLAPAGIATDANFLYWTNVAGRQVMACQKSDCAATLVTLASNLDQPAGIAVNNIGVFFADNDRILAVAKPTIP